MELDFYQQDDEAKITSVVLSPFSPPELLQLYRPCGLERITATSRHRVTSQRLS